jgi:hypothetical protein
MNIRIGTKLAITVGIGVVLVAGMIVNQQLSNTSVARQTELARDEQFAIAYLLSASVALQRMQVGTREIRLAISEREADQALAGLRGSMDDAVDPGCNTIVRRKLRPAREPRRVGERLRRRRGRDDLAKKRLRRNQ